MAGAVSALGVQSCGGGRTAAGGVRGQSADPVHSGARSAENSQGAAAGDAEEHDIRGAIVSRLANIVPALVLSCGASVIPDVHDTLETIIRNVCNAFIVLTSALALARMLDLIELLYRRRPDAATKPIKGYLQLLKIFLTIVAVILMIAMLINRNPLILLSGLGAMAAVLMLIFQDTLLSLVASIQLGTNDMVRIGDWIEMPSQNADGNVIEVALHTVKVQNWDKTITTIPVRKLITDSFKNWRGMQESGGRRIKRALYLDQRSVRFLSDSEIRRLEEFVLLNDYLERKRRELAEWNARLEAQGAKPINERRVTNLGTFRAYVELYLRSNPNIRQDMTLLVRQLQPGVSGIPLEIYCFTAQHPVGGVRGNSIGSVRSSAGDPSGVRSARLPAVQRHVRHDGSSVPSAARGRRRRTARAQPGMISFLRPRVFPVRPRKNTVHPGRKKSSFPDKNSNHLNRRLFHVSAIPGTLQTDEIPPLRPKRTPASGHLPRPVAEFRFREHHGKQH